MKKIIIYQCYFFSLLLLLSFKPAQYVAPGAPIKEGISGKVLWREGNFFPSIDGKKNSNLSEGVVREIYIYATTKVSQATRDAEFYKDIQTKLISKITSKTDGAFQVPLPPGTYSIFTKEEGGLFANISDGEGNIFPVTVEPGKITRITIVVDYKASY